MESKETDHESFMIEIKTLYGKSINVEASKSDTIYDIKHQIYEQEGIPIHIQHIQCNNKTTSDNTIIDESSGLILVLKLKGGSPVVMCCCDCSYGDHDEEGAHDLVVCNKRYLAERDWYNEYKQLHSHNCCIDGCEIWCCCTPNDWSCDTDCIFWHMSFFGLPCLSWICCLFQYYEIEQQIEKEWTGKIIAEAKFLNLEIIENWDEYKRMFKNIQWKTELDTITAQQINSMNNRRHYALINTIFQNTNNTPSRIRNKQNLIEIVNQEKEFEYPLFILIKCEAVDVAEWLNRLGLYRYYGDFVGNGYCDMSLVSGIKDKQKLKGIGIYNHANQKLLLEEIRELKSCEEKYYQWRESTPQHIVQDIAPLFNGRRCCYKNMGALEVKCKNCKKLYPTLDVNDPEFVQRKINNDSQRNSNLSKQDDLCETLLTTEDDQWM